MREGRRAGRESRKRPCKRARCSRKLFFSVADFFSLKILFIRTPFGAFLRRLWRFSPRTLFSCSLSLLLSLSFFPLSPFVFCEGFEIFSLPSLITSYQKCYFLNHCYLRCVQTAAESYSLFFEIQHWRIFIFIQIIIFGFYSLPHSTSSPCFALHCFSLARFMCARVILKKLFLKI